MRSGYRYLLLVCLAAVVAGCASVDSAAYRPKTLPATATVATQNLRVLPDGDPIDMRRLERSDLGFTPADRDRIRPRITKNEAIAKSRPDLFSSAAGPVSAAADLGYLASVVADWFSGKRQGP